MYVASVTVYVRACGNELVELKHDGAQSFILLSSFLRLYFLLFISLPMTHFVYKFFVRIYYQAAFYDVKMIPKLGFVPKLKTILQQPEKEKKTK